MDWPGADALVVCLGSGMPSTTCCVKDFLAGSTMPCMSVDLLATAVSHQIIAMGTTSQNSVNQHARV